VGVGGRDSSIIPHFQQHHWLISEDSDPHHIGSEETPHAY
jgi:hypothetical protein